MTSFALIFPLLLAAGAAAAGQPLAWEDPGYPAEFRYFEESGRFSRSSWEALSGESRERELSGAAAPAGKRYEQVKAYYAAVSARWKLGEVSESLARLDEASIRAVRIWLGGDCAAYLERKKLALQGLLAPGSRLSRETAAAAAPYLDSAAVSELSSALKAGGATPEALAKQQKRQSALSSRVSGLGGAYGESMNGGSGELFFDNAAGRGDATGLGGQAALPSGGSLQQREISSNFRASLSKTVSSAEVPQIQGSAPKASPPASFPAEDLKRIDKAVSEMKSARQAAGSENGWLGNFRQSVGLTKADSGCSGWSAASISAIKNDPVLREKYEVGYVRGLRNPIGAVTKWPPSAPLPLPHFVAVVWPKGTDPNDTAIYVDAWAAQTKRGPIGEYTREYSFDPKDLTPTVYYEREVKKEIKLAGGKTRVVTETVETPVPLVKANPWIFFK